MEEMQNILHNIKKQIEELETLISLNNKFKNCLLCEEWNNGLMRCSKYNMVPPPNIIVHGCANFIVIPF